MHLEGEAAPRDRRHHRPQSLQLEVEATHIPESITVSVEGLDRRHPDPRRPGRAARGRRRCVTDAEALVVNVTAQVSAEALEAELSEAEAEAGIEREESDEEAGEAAEAEAAAAEGDKASDEA